MQKSRSEGRPVVRKSYAFDREPVHYAYDPLPGEPLPQHKCFRCHRDLPQEEFGPVAPAQSVGSRVSRTRYAQALHPHCFKCREQARGKWTAHPLYSPALDRFFDRLLWGARSGARARGILFALEKSDALDLYFNQEGRCAVTGLVMDWQTPGRKGRNGRNYKAPSLDRINSAGNYVLGNVHVVMQIINVMKNDLPLDMFVALCRRVADHNISL